MQGCSADVMLCGLKGLKDSFSSEVGRSSEDTKTELALLYHYLVSIPAKFENILG